MMHGYQKISVMMQRDKDLRAVVKMIIRILIGCLIRATDYVFEVFQRLHRLAGYS